MSTAHASQRSPVAMHAGASMPAVDLAYAYFDALNRHDLETIRQLCTPDCDFDFGKEFMMRVEDHEIEAQRLFASFPNYRFEYKDVYEVDEITAVVGHSVGMGTHTGAPFGFGPYPEINAAGVKVVNDPQIVTMKVKSGRITKITIKCKIPGSDKTGPPGIYRQLGGFPM